jgi:hypothetical protein
MKKTPCRKCAEIATAYMIDHLDGFTIYQVECDDIHHGCGNAEVMTGEEIERG